VRKLRTDITLHEAREAWEAIADKTEGQKFSEYCHELWCNTMEWVKHTDRAYPDSFYEQPPINSFGYGQSYMEHEVWGYLEAVDNSDHMAKYRIRGVWYKDFTPGLPRNVDADGYPKEATE
jgi:hypothetical protein